ncbi:fibrous sheath-interacting protein 2-like [Dama dama]
MTWVVAAVTSVLYPAITKYEERLQNITCPMPDNSTLSSDGESCCSTCCETSLYQTSKMVQAGPCTEAADRSIEQRVAPSKSSFARKERTDVETTYHRKEHLENKPKAPKPDAPKPKYNEVSESPNLKPCKSDSHLVVRIETGTRKCKDATTETDGLECPLSSDEKAKAISEMQELNNVFVNFHHHLKEEVELILGNIFQEMVSELTQTIPTLPSVTTEALPAQTDTDKEDLLSNVDISSAAAEIMENVFEKLQSAVKKTCTEEFSPENVSVHFKSNLVSGEHCISPKEKTSEVSLPYALENMNDVAEDMVRVILEKLTVLASSKQSELAHLKITTDPAYQQHREDPMYTFLQRASKRKSSAKADAASLIGKEEIQNLVSNICSQSSLVGYIKEAISTILGYIQVGLNNERLVATKETVVILQLLDALLAQLHQKPVKTDVQKSRHSRMSSPSGTEERNRLTSTGVASAPRCRSPFPPINVPGMVLYSEDEKEEIDRIVENVLISSTKDEKAKLQEQVPDYWLTGANADFKRKRNMNLPTKPAYRRKVAFHDQGLNTDLPTFNKDPLKDKPGLNKDILLFSQDETYQIQKASEDIIRSILAELLKDLSSGPSDHSDYEDGREASLLTSRKPQDPSHQEWMDQMFSVSEIHMVSQDIVDDILKILHITSCHIIRHSSSVHQTSLNNADVPNEESLQIWFDSKRKMKFLSALSVDPTKLPWVESGTSGSTSESVDNLIDKIINTIFKKLNSFICPKLQTCFKPESHATHSKPAPDKKSSFRSHLSTFTTKVVKIVLDAIHKELRHNKKNLNVRKNSPPKNFRDTGFFADAENELDSVVTKLNNDIMTSSLATCICEVLSGNTDKSNILVPSDKLRSKISHGTDGIDQQKLLPSHCPCMQEEVHQCTRFQVLDRIGDALYDMLCKLTGDHPHSPLSDEQNTEGINKNLRTTSTLRSSIKLISHTILEGIVSKLCGVDTDGIFKNSEFKAISEHIDTDSLSFALLLEEMSRCYDVISSIASSVTWPGNQEVTNKGKTTAPKIVTTKEKHLNKLKTLASDIFEMVFATLEGFANRNLENLGGNKTNKTYCENENTNICGNTHEKRLQSTLYRHAKKVSSTILKALQTEINMNLPDLDTCISKPLQEKQILKSLVNFILEAISPDTFNEPEPEERGIKNYRYRPIYGNFLPGGADPDSYLEDPADTEKESAGEERPTEDETKSDSLKQQELEKTLKTFEVELKEPKKSPLVPIVRSILNEIFQNDLIGQLKAFTLPQSHLCDTPHADDEPFAQTSVESLDKTVGPLVSEADVTIVADDVIRTIFQKLYSAAMTDRNESENRYNTITFPADISFPKHTRGGKSPVCSTILDRNPCTLQSTFNIGKLTKINLVEDIIQSILTNLEAFATSKVKALFCPHISFTVPMALPSQQDEIALQQPWLSTKDSYSEDQFSCCSMDHSKSGKTTSICQLSASKLNMYATEVARQILQGIKHKLDQDLRSPFLTHSVVAFESIPSQVVNTVLDIVSTKGKYEKNVFDRETDPVAPEDIIEKLFNKSDYRKKLQFQILDTIEGILIDICEETIDENNLPLAVSTLNCNVSRRHLETNSERDPRYVNKAILTLLVPKECVAMISNDMVDIVLQNLTSAIMVCISANDSISPILSTEFSDAFSKAEHQQSPSKDSVNGRAERQQPIVTNSVNERAKRKQPPVIDSVNERKRERFPFARKGRDVQLKSALSDDNQTTVLKKQDAKKSTPDPCKENAHFITKTILNRLKSFATERIDLLLILDPETREKPDVGSEFTNCKQNDSVFLESNQTPLDVTVPKISTAGTILSQEVTNYTLANYRENRRPAIHISQASLKEYADLIANTILTLIKNDIDLEIQKMYTYQNNTSFQENIIASETVNNILKSLCNKISLKASGFYLKQDPDLFTQLAVQNEIVPGQREMEDHTKLSVFSKYSGENQKTPEVENQRRTLEEKFRNGESGQEKTNSLLSVVKEILKKAYQRVWENTERCSPFNELPHFTSDSKIKTSAQKKALQSHISSVANDIVESVYRKMFSVIMTSLYENSETRGEMEASGSDGLLMNPSCFRELKQAEKSSDPPKPVIPRVYPYTGIGSVSSLENTSLQFSPLRLGEHLVQQVLKKISDFALLNLEESSSPKGQSDEILRPCSSKASPKGSPRASVKTNFKTKSKVTSLAKFGTKPQLRPIGAKAQSKTKLGLREKTLKGSWSKTSVGLPHLLSIGEAKTPSLRAKLPTAELKMYARDIVHNILQTIVNEFEEVRQNRAVVNVNTLLSDQIERASGIVNAVLQGLHAMKNNLANPIKGSHSDDIKLPRGYFSTTSAANPEAHFTLENVSSQLDKLFPKEDIFKQMFDKWQTESSNMENEKDKLLMIAKAVLNQISTKAGELEQSVSLLTLSLLEPCESRHHHFKRAASRVEDSQAQINIFGQEIIKKLFEKLELCFLTQMFTTDSKETLQSKKETAARRKCGSLGTNNLNNVPTYNTKLKDKTLGIAGHQITQEILEGVLNTLESFVDLQFKHVSTYAFSELVRTPIENFFAMQQKPPMKTIFPKLQTLTTFPDESKSSSMISQENIDNALQQLYFFHSELLTYAVNTVTDMLSIIKNKLDKEECHKEPSSTSIFEENIVANQIISTLMDQCTYFYELMIKNHPKENLLQGAKNACTVNCSRFTTGPEMSTSKSKGISCWDDPPQISSLLSYSEEDTKIKDKTSLDVPACVSHSIGDSTKTIEPMEGLESEFKPSSSRSEAHVFSYFDQAVKRDSSLPEDTVSQISSQKSSDPARAALEHPMSFRETEEGENQRVLHYEPLKPLVNPDEIQTTISPLKICLAAEDIVNTMLTSFGLSNQTLHTTENTETMKPFFISKESLHCLTSEQLKNEKSLLKIWEERNSYGTEEENKGLVASGEDSVLLEKWKNKYLKLEKTLEEPGVIAFADWELGPHEVHLVARYVTTSVVTHFNNFETRGE